MRHQVLTALLLAAGAANAASPSGFGLDVLVNGSPRPEFAARGTVYVEALKGHDFSLRVTNPLGVRVAVALSVDGLNTIDAKHTSAIDARKWVLDPYQTVVIPGWQVSGETSRKFFFTGEKGSYGAKLGETSNLGAIEAVFFRERLPYRAQRPWSGGKEEDKISSNERGKGAGRLDEPRVEAAAGAAQLPAPSESVARDHSKKSSSPPPSSLADEMAATGIGSRTRFDVTRVNLDLEDSPAASVRLRYEFRPQLVALGVLPSDPDPARIARRERARGFEDFCPEPR